MNIKNVLVFASFIIVIGLLYIIFGYKTTRTGDNKALSLNEVDFTNFSFDKDQFYAAHVEINGEPFYEHARYDTDSGHMYYYDGIIKNNKNQEMHIIYVMSAAQHALYQKNKDKDHDYIYYGYLKNVDNQVVDMHKNLNKEHNITDNVYSIILERGLTQSYLVMGFAFLFGAALVLVIGIPYSLIKKKVTQ